MRFHGTEVPESAQACLRHLVPPCVNSMAARQQSDGLPYQQSKNILCMSKSEIHYARSGGGLKLNLLPTESLHASVTSPLCAF
jgi:hypothetical protein